ncbi:hypothetical protein SETIT_3G211200v2 [Setaria italica]|uniref:ATP-dependent DNA helicase n=1 Tax=Setaria italica TaxID=4555 RepID=A0A368QH68_SETIT|nr:hypothetical protein SETIT_3G211200v2 [Setaria italica]
MKLIVIGGIAGGATVAEAIGGTSVADEAPATTDGAVTAAAVAAPAGATTGVCGVGGVPDGVSIGEMDMLVFKDGPRRGKGGILPRHLHDFWGSGCLRGLFQKDCNHQAGDREMERYFQCICFGKEVEENFEVKSMFYSETGGHVLTPDFDTIVLSKDFPGSDHDVQSRFMDAMTLVARYDKPDYFMTMTCNPYWDEIMVELLPRQTPQDHPILLPEWASRHVAAWAHVTEFQKRGLPHEHFLLVMEAGSKLKSPDDYDRYILAEITNPNKYPQLHQLVVKYMMHSPCGTLNKYCPCMFNETTQQDKDTYPIYRRRDDGKKVKVRGKELDNMWVVPYNLVLLMRYNCHINIEICSSIKSVKYLYKYIYKGHDRASFTIDAKGNEHMVINEIKQYRDARMITAIEEMQVHLPDLPMVAYKSTNNLKDVLLCQKSQRPMLTEYFKMNATNPNAHQYQYKEFAEYFTWNKSGKYWKPRFAKKTDFRLVLLNLVRGATSYENLKTWHGITNETFRAATEAMGFVDTNKSLGQCLIECAMVRFPSSLCRIFATIMVFYECTNICHLWDKHYESLAEDFQCANDNNTMVEASFEEILDHVIKGKGQIFFVDSPGGTSKTYLYKALLVKVHSMDLIAIATATSGIAASIMPGGRTAHSRFKIPIKLSENTMCSFTKQSGTTELLRRASMIIWDRCTQPFGGKVMLVGGDFREVLPVVAHGTRAQITNVTLLRSYIWQSVRRIRLTQNMRAQSDTWFADYLLRIDNGTEETFGDDYSYMRERAILSTRNEHVDAVNALMIDRFPGSKQVCYNFDSVEDGPWNNYPLDFLNSITPNGLPPHELTIKKNCPVILLRNLDPHNGLCKGTRSIFIYASGL